MPSRKFHDLKKIFGPCQTSMPIIYILKIMMSQHDILNETTVSSAQ